MIGNLIIEDDWESKNRRAGKNLVIEDVTGDLKMICRHYDSCYMIIH